MLRGKVQFVDRNHQCGYILNDDGERIFFEAKGCKDFSSVFMGTIVEFDLIEDDKGVLATNIQHDIRRAG